MDRVSVDQPWNMPRKCKFCDNDVDSSVPTTEKRWRMKGGLFSLCQ